MKFLTHLINAFKLTNLTYPYQNALTYASFAVGGHKSTQKRSFESERSGGELNNDEGFQEAFAILSLLRDNSLQVELLTQNLEELKTDGKKDGDSVITAVDIKKPKTNISHEMRKGISLEKSTLSLSTNTRLLPYDTTTIPLHLNTLINGIINRDPKRDSEYQLQSVKVPEFNEYLTSLAANLCSAAFQSGFPNESYKKYYSTENTLDVKSIQNQDDKKNYQLNKKIDSASDEVIEELLKKYDEFQNGINVLAASSTVAGKENKKTKRDPNIVYVGVEKKGSGNAENPPCIPEKATQLEKTQKSKGVLNGLGLLDPELYKKSLKEAEKRRKELTKASASCKEKLSIRACQSKKSKQSEIKDPCKSGASTSKCKTEIESKSKSKTKELKFASEKLVSKNSDPTCESLSVKTKSDAPNINSDGMPSKASSKSNAETKTDCGSKKIFESKSSLTMKQQISKCLATESPLEMNTSSKTSSKSEKISVPKTVEDTSKSSPKPEPTTKTSLNCGRKSESKLEDPCKVPSAPKPSTSCGLSSRTEDPCHVPSITFNKSASNSKCSAPSKPKCEEKPSPSAKKPASASKYSPIENSKDPSKKPSKTTASKCSSKCSSTNSCIKIDKQSIVADSDKACKRVSMDVKKSCGDSKPKNPCKSPCDSMNKPKSKCGRPPRGDTRPRCKKDSNCGSKKISPCASKEKSEPKCGTDVKPPLPAEPSKCKSKTCAPSPKSSETKLKTKSTCITDTKSKTTAPSSEPPKRQLHSLSNFSVTNSIFRRNFSDDCPQKPKDGYKLETKRSDEYRRETCENFSWKASKLRKKRTKQPKNCYPDETLEFCPDTACYKVYAETSRKSNKKRNKKNPQGSK